MERYRGYNCGLVPWQTWHAKVGEVLGCITLIYYCEIAFMLYFNDFVVDTWYFVVRT